MFHFDSLLTTCEREPFTRIRQRRYIFHSWMNIKLLFVAFGSQYLILLVQLFKLILLLLWLTRVGCAVIFLQSGRSYDYYAAISRYIVPAAVMYIVQANERHHQKGIYNFVCGAHSLCFVSVGGRGVVWCYLLFAQFN